MSGAQRILNACVFGQDCERMGAGCYFLVFVGGKFEEEVGNKLRSPCEGLIQNRN